MFVLIPMRLPGTVNVGPGVVSGVLGEEGDGKEGDISGGVDTVEEREFVCVGSGRPCG